VHPVTFTPYSSACFQASRPGKGRQKGWVDVHNALIKGAQEFAFQDAHEPRQHDEIDLRFSQAATISPFPRRRSSLVRNFPGGIYRVEMPSACARQGFPRPGHR